jgi:hypothetical protein
VRLNDKQGIFSRSGQAGRMQPRIDQKTRCWRGRHSSSIRSRRLSGPVWSVWSKRRRPARVRWFAVGLAVWLIAGAGRAGALVEFANVSERVTLAQFLGYLARTDQGRSQPLSGCTAVGPFRSLRDDCRPAEVSGPCGAGGRQRRSARRAPPSSSYSAAADRGLRPRRGEGGVMTSGTSGAITSGADVDTTASRALPRPICFAIVERRSE